jgi:hypothetical protein
MARIASREVFDNSNVPSKKCSNCGELKVLTEFYKREQKGHSKDGYTGVCKDCRRAQWRLWGKTNRKLTPAKIEAIKRWQQRNTKKRMEAKRLWRKRNRDKYMISCQRCSRNRRIRHPESVRGGILIWLRKNPKARNAHETLRRAVKKGLVKKSSECEWCGTKECRLHGHHEDYEKPLDVQWLCSSCHAMTREKRNGE